MCIGENESELSYQVRRMKLEAGGYEFIGNFDRQEILDPGKGFGAEWFQDKKLDVPQPTDWYSGQELAKMGLIGVYRRVKNGSVCPNEPDKNL